MYHVVHRRPVPRRRAKTVPRDARAELLERSIAHVARHGFADGSLRAMAAALGTSHRMLIYHFSSAEVFWAEVLAGLRRREQAALTESAAQGAAPSIDEVWANLSSAGSLPRMRLLFEMYGRALAEPERHRAFLSEVVGDWLDTMGPALAKQFRLTPAQARLQARLRLAVVRGLILDLLTTGDRAGTSAALRWFAVNARPVFRKAGPRKLKRIQKRSV